jgi:hypothetical protein
VRATGSRYYSTLGIGVNNASLITGLGLTWRDPRLAGVALETAELAGEIADGLMCYLTTRTRYQQVVARMQRGAGAAGFSPHPHLSV